MPVLSFHHAADFAAMRIADLGMAADALLGARQSFNLLGCLANHMRRPDLEDFGDDFASMVDAELAAIAAELERRELTEIGDMEDRDAIIQRVHHLIGAAGDRYEITVNRVAVEEGENAA